MQDILIDYSFLRPKLPIEWAKILSEKHGLSEDSIRKIVKGDRRGKKYEAVITDLVNMAKAHKEKMVEIEEKAKQI